MWLRGQVDKGIGQIQEQIDVPMQQVAETFVERPHIVEEIVMKPHVAKEVFERIMVPFPLTSLPRVLFKSTRSRSQARPPKRSLTGL